MNSNQYFYILIPSILVCEIIITLIFPNSNALRAISFKESLALTYTSFALILINHKLQKRFESQFTMKYILPLVEESLKIIVPIFNPAIGFIHILWLVLGTSFIFVEYSPRDYDKYYSEFLRAYRAFTSHEELNLTTKNSVSFSHFLRELESDRESVTLTSDGSDIIKKNSLRSFPATIDRSIHSTKRSGSISILNESATSEQQLLIDKLYSVSPKDTYHLDEETMNAYIIQNDAVCDSISNKSETIENNSLCNKIDLDDPLFSSDLANSNNYGATDTRFGGSFNYMHSLDQKEEVSNTNWLKYIDWLVPITLWKRQVQNNLYENSHTIKKKLSCYTLNSIKDEESSLLYSSKTIDMDCDNDKFFEFKRYVDAYFDISSNGKGFPIDPIFKRYNVLLVDIPTVYVFIDLIDSVLWNFITFLIVTIYHIDIKLFSLLYPTCIITKYFKKNFLKTIIINYRARLLVYLLIDILYSISLYMYVNFI